ncbi:MAG: FlgD immunoglobulin-like domain containing protein, partial [bacterium]
SEHSPEPPLRKNFILYANYPNPFNPETRIRFDILKSRATIRLMIFGVLGREVTLLFDGERAAGTYEFVWDGTDKHGRQVASGIYFYRLEIDNNAIETKKMLLLR